MRLRSHYSRMALATDLASRATRPTVDAARRGLRVCLEVPRVRRPTLTLSALCMALAMLLSLSSSAHAERIYPFAATFDSGQAQGPSPFGLAVDTSSNPSDPSIGDVYVSDGNVINKFKPSSAIAGNSSPDAQITGFYDAFGLAVDPADGDLYVSDAAKSSEVFKYDASGNPIGSFSLQSSPPIYCPGGVAVNPANGNLFVADLCVPSIYEFTSSGLYTGNTFDAPAAAHGLALGPSGRLYAASGSGTVFFDTAGCPTLPTCTESSLLTANPSNGVTVDPANGDVFVAEANKVSVFEEGGTEIVNGFGEKQLGASSANGIGLSSNGSFVYVADSSADSADVFGPEFAGPNVATAAASNVGIVTATLNGHVEPADGGPVIDCRFQYGHDTSYGETIPCLDNANNPVGTASDPIASTTEVHADIVAPTSFTRYHYRLTASNASGENTGQDRTLITGQPNLPEINDNYSSNVTSTSATLDAQINPGFGPTIARFEYGATTLYGSRTYPTESVGSDDADHTASTEVSGLAPATTYHFRAIATNFTGTVYGPDRTFNTTGPPSVSIATASAISTTTPLLNAQVKPGMCSKGYVKKHARCVKKLKPHHKQHHKHGGRK